MRSLFRIELNGETVFPFAVHLPDGWTEAGKRYILNWLSMLYRREESWVIHIPTSS